MATIITVHGTNDTGEPVAEKAGEGQWWQKDSYFEHHLRELVEADNGELKFEPHVWDGKNSERSRWRAGENLHRQAWTLERHKEPYAVVGHSLGGSVVCHAPENSMLRRRLLHNLKRWITIGTPFVHNRIDRFLFNRLIIPGKAAYIILMLFILFFVPLHIFVISLMFDPVTNLSFHNLLEELLPMTIALGFSLLMIYALRCPFEPGRHRVLRSKTLVQVGRKLYSPKWDSLWHSDDEAVRGLELLNSLEFKPFSRVFATQTLLILSIILFFILLIGFLGSKDATDWIFEFGKLMTGKDIETNVKAQTWYSYDSF